MFSNSAHNIIIHPVLGSQIVLCVVYTRAHQALGYDAQISIFGIYLQKELEEENVFVVGAGALGCEFLNIFVSWGISYFFPKSSTFFNFDTRRGITTLTNC